jgi:hypothetical protein
MITTKVARANSAASTASAIVVIVNTDILFFSYALSKCQFPR